MGKHKVLKTTLFTLLSVILALGIFFVVINYLYNQQNINEYEDEKKYFQSIPNTKKIFILGSSHVNALNPFIIEKHLESNDLDYRVYNLGKVANKPQRQIDTIDLIISAKPDIVVYGIASRDFSDANTNEQIVKPVTTFFEPPNIADGLVTLMSKSGIAIFESDFSPKLITLKSLRGVAGTPTDYMKAPFFRFDYQRDFTTMPDKELRDNALGYDQKVNIQSPTTNKDLIALKQIIEKLKQNDIKIIIFTTPQHKYYLDLVSDDEKESFNLILDDLQSSTDLQIYSFTDKYSDLDVWRNPTHIVVSKSESVYSDDISQLILGEIGP
jgi:hypothetical protein